MTRRAFLALASLVTGGVLAHHKPGHRGGPATTTTTLPPSEESRWSDVWSEVW
jgi:hypothetical protein